MNNNVFTSFIQNFIFGAELTKILSIYMSEGY